MGQEYFTQSFPLVYVAIFAGIMWVNHPMKEILSGTRWAQKQGPITGVKQAQAGPHVRRRRSFIGAVYNPIYNDRRGPT